MFLISQPDLIILEKWIDEEYKILTAWIHNWYVSMASHSSSNNRSVKPLRKGNYKLNFEAQYQIMFLISQPDLIILEKWIDEEYKILTAWIHNWYVSMASHSSSNNRSVKPLRKGNYKLNFEAQYQIIFLISQPDLIIFGKWIDEEYKILTAWIHNWYIVSMASHSSSNNRSVKP